MINSFWIINNRATENIEKPEKNVTKFTKAKTKFYSKLYYQDNESYLHVNKRWRFVLYPFKTFYYTSDKCNG